MTSFTILLVSSLTQTAAAVVAGRRILVSGRKTAWALVTLGFSLMALRRWITLSEHLADPAYPPALLPESIILLISVLMLVGIHGLDRVFGEMETQASELARAGAERQELLADVEESRRRLSALFDHMHDGFAYGRLIHDEYGRPVDAVFLEVNEAFVTRITGGVGRLVGRRVSEVVPHTLEEEFDWLGFFDGVGLQPGAVDETEQYLASTDKWLHVTAYGTEPDHYAAVFTDVTDSRRSREELEERVAEKTGELAEANARLREVMASRSRFFASASHELRSPLNGVIGFSGILLSGAAGALNDEQRRQIDMIRSSGYHLLTLVNDILDLSKLEAGRLQVLFEEVGLDDLLSETVASYAHQAEQKGLGFVVDRPSVGCVVLTDPTRLRQIVSNLLSNAVRYTVSGSVTIGYRHAEDEVELWVRDTGPGIPAECIDSVFEPYVTGGGAADETGADTGGTGLGLAVVERLCELLGAGLSVDSREGEGTEFMLTVPLATGSGDEADAEVCSSGADGRPGA